jgi:mannose-6-phosphate isomerase-like protein (cupin superfamily)
MEVNNMIGFKTNIEQDTIENENYRKVLFTGEKMQLVVMSLKAGEDIPLEVHNDIDQFLRIEKGQASVKIGEEEFNLKDDDVIIIPAGNKHYVKNTGESDLKLYSIYATPEHAPGTVHKTKEEADSAEHHH